MRVSPSHTAKAILLQCLFLFLFSLSLSLSVHLCVVLSLLFQKRKRISRARLIRFDVPARVAKAISSSGPSPLSLPIRARADIIWSGNAQLHKGSTFGSYFAGPGWTKCTKIKHVIPAKLFTNHLHRAIAASTDPATATVPGGQL